MLNPRIFTTLNWLSGEDDNANNLGVGFVFYSENDADFAAKYPSVVGKIHAARAGEEATPPDTALAIAFNEVAARIPFAPPSPEFWMAMETWGVTGEMPPEGHPLDTAPVGTTHEIEAPSGAPAAMVTKTELGVAIHVEATKHHSEFSILAHNVGAVLVKWGHWVANGFHKL